MEINYQVIKRDSGWAVIREGAKRAASLHDLKADAIMAAKGLSKQPPLVANQKQGQGKASLAQRVGERLRRARMMRGHNLRSLSEIEGVEMSHTSIQKLEKGLSMPDTTQLANLAKALNVRVEYFLKKEGLKLNSVEYRKQAKLGVKAQNRLEEQAFEFFERYLEIEQIMGIDQLELERADFSELSEGELPKAIEKLTSSLREKWQLGANPIANVHSMLEQQGVKVKILPEEKGFDGFSAFAAYNQKKIATVALSAERLEDLPRFRFTALHELGHLIMILPSGLEERTKENMCHRFAGSFLFPKDAFLAELGASRKRISIPELKALKSVWGISFAAIMRRALDLGCITQGSYKGYFFMATKYKIRTHEPQTWFGNETSERFEGLVYRALAEQVITSSKASALLGKSLGEISKEFELL